jgi:glycosyltransferase involved in cell wall biosynthesis
MNGAAVTFVLPGDNRSGGVRVTALMGNLLLDRGWRVRIAYIRQPRLTARWLRRQAERALRVCRPRADEGWLHLFRGETAPFTDLNELTFEKGEVVLSVGTFTVPHLVGLRADVKKVRFNHGFPAEMTPECTEAWSHRMPTIAVSESLVARLERLSGEKVLAIVPNGVDMKQYHVMPGVRRDSIGIIWSEHENKAPEDIVALMHRVGAELPHVPRIVFSAETCPEALRGIPFERYPPIYRVREIYNSALIWLLPSRTEGLPGPVLEAMACGAVVISSDNEGSLEVVEDGVSGLIVKTGDLDAFMAAIRRVLGDEALRARLAEGGLTTARRFTWDRAAEKMDAFLRTVAPSPPSGR